MLKVEARPQLPSLFFSCFIYFFAASHNWESSCHQWRRRGHCLKERVEVAVLVLVSWGPEEAAGMALTTPPPNPTPPSPQSFSPPLI